MGIQDVAFLFYCASFCIAFLKHCGKDKSLFTATCRKIVIGGRQQHAPVE